MLNEGLMCLEYLGGDPVQAQAKPQRHRQRGAGERRVGGGGLEKHFRDHQLRPNAIHNRILHNRLGDSILVIGFL